MRLLKVQKYYICPLCQQIFENIAFCGRYLGRAEVFWGGFCDLSCGLKNLKNFCLKRPFLILDGIKIAAFGLESVLGCYVYFGLDSKIKMREPGVFRGRLLETRHCVSASADKIPTTKKKITYGKTGYYIYGAVGGYPL